MFLSCHLFERNRPNRVLDLPLLLPLLVLLLLPHLVRRSRLLLHPCHVLLLRVRHLLLTSFSLPHAISLVVAVHALQPRREGALRLDLVVDVLVDLRSLERAPRWQNARILQVDSPTRLALLLIVLAKQRLFLTPHFLLHLVEEQSRAGRQRRDHVASPQTGCHGEQRALAAGHLHAHANHLTDLV